MTTQTLRTIGSVVSLLWCFQHTLDNLHSDNSDRISVIKWIHRSAEYLTSQLHKHTGQMGKTLAEMSSAEKGDKHV